MIILYGKDENKLVSKYNTTIKETNVEYGISNAIDTEPTEYSLIVPKVRMKLFNRNKNYFYGVVLKYYFLMVLIII